MSCLKCLLCCASAFGCKDALTRRFAFYPPSPPSYSIVHKDGALQLIAENQFGEAVEPVEASWIHCSLQILLTPTGNRIPALYFENMNASFTLIYSHGNSTDIGLMRNYAADLSIQLKVNILLYEYTGYGQSSGRSTEKNLHADIYAAYAFLIGRGTPWYSIVLYGQSLGSGPSCYLASEYPVAGVILHSPFASGLLMLSKRFDKPPAFDIFSNIKRVPYIRCPVFLIHGTNDTQVNQRHSEWLSERIHFAWPPWWVAGASHHNIETDYRKTYLDKLREFLGNLSELIDSASKDEDLGIMLKPFRLSLAPDKLPPCLLAWPQTMLRTGRLSAY